MSEKIIPTGDNVVLQIIEQQKTASGLFIPEKARGNQRDAVLGKVMAVGPGRVSEYGVKIEAGVKEGDYVLLSRGAGVEVESETGKLRIIRGVELLGTVEESRIVRLNEAASSGLVLP